MIGTNLAITPKSYFRGLSLDPDAQIYISAANITDTTQQSAVNQLVLDFKSIGVWTKEKAIYPILGGTASSHKWNLKDPRDLSAAFRFNFSTGWTHSSNGMTPSNAYANSYLNPTTISLGQNSIHLSYYSRTNSNGNADIGLDTWSSPYTYAYIRAGSNVSAVRLNTGNVEVSTSTTNSLGLFTFIRNSSTTININKNGVNNSLSQTSTGVSNGSVLFGGMQSTSFEYGNKQCAFASIGDGLTDTEAVNKTVAVQKYQRALGRAVDMEIQVGTGATRSYYTPFSTLDNYSISGNIYLQSEVIGAAIPMLGIEMYFSGFTLPYSLVNQEIYLAHVTQSQFDSAPAVDFSDLTLSNLTLVKASFTFTAANNAWVRMNFDTPFQYNGTSNILVIWKNNRGTWSSGGGGSDTHVSTSRSMYKVGSTGQPTGNGTLTNNRSNIKFIW
jgi:hypothetical protein